MINIDPMTQQKENDMNRKLMKHSCPICGCDFEEKILKVTYQKTTLVDFKYSKEKKDWIGEEENKIEDKLFSIVCSNCDGSLYSYFLDEFEI